MKQEVYKIGGMSCAACSSAVERVTRRMEGVSRSDVNLTTAKMRIEYDESLVSPEQIIKKIEKAGFSAEMYVDDKEKQKICRWGIWCRYHFRYRSFYRWNSTLLLLRWHSLS